MARLRFTMRGEGDDDTVDAADFSSFLGALLSCLRAIEEDSGAQAPVEYRVVDLEIGSAAIELEPVSSGDLDKSADAVASSFERGFQALQSDNIRRAEFSRKTKSRFLDLVKPLRKATREIEFRGSGDPVSLSRRTPVRDLPQPKTEAVARGSLKGNIDALNVHSTPVFYLYPPSGPTRVRCTFATELLDDLRHAIKRSTSVFGLMEYSAGSAFPSRIQVERVEVHPSDSELPTLASFWGAAPDLTGDQTTREYLDAVRDE